MAMGFSPFFFGQFSDGLLPGMVTPKSGRTASPDLIPARMGPGAGFSKTLRLSRDPFLPETKDRAPTPQEYK